MPPLPFESIPRSRNNKSPSNLCTEGDLSSDVCTNIGASTECSMKKNCPINVGETEQYIVFSKCLRDP